MPTDALLDKCVRTVRQEGVAALGVKIAGRLRRAAFETNCANWYCADLSRRREQPAASDEVDVSFAAADEVADWFRRLNARFTWVYDPKELDAARRYDHVFAVLSCRNVRAGYIKIAFRRAYIADFDRSVAVPSHSAFVYDTFVHPDYRGRGLAACMIRRAMDHLRDRSTRFLWCHIPQWNTASIGAFTRCGFIQAGYVRYVRLFTLKVFTRDPEHLMNLNVEDEP